MKYNFALCDDGKDQLDILEYYLMDIANDIKCAINIDKFYTGLEFLNYFQTNQDKYDIIFLDIEMPNIDGIMVGKLIRELNNNVIVIYVTGYRKFALQAFNIRVFDYILKPINLNKIKHTVEDAIKRIEYLRQIDSKDAQILTINYNKSIMNIKMNNIISLEKIGNKINIVCFEDRYQFYGTFQEITKKLDNTKFIQVHQGYIVNLEKVSRYENQNLVMMNECIIPVSKKNIKTVRDAFFESLR